MTCFVSVGTTKFDGLMYALDSPKGVDVLENLHHLGIRHLIMQIGDGYRPNAFIQLATEREGFSIDIYDYKPSIKADMELSTFIISHAGMLNCNIARTHAVKGAGTILETLRMQKPLIVVVNESLMNNHQWEVASALEKDKYVLDFCGIVL